MATDELAPKPTDPVIDRTQDREPVAIVTLQSDVGGRAFDIDWTLAADALEPGQHKLYTHPPVEPEGARDHEAMEILRSASLKKGWKWQWDGMDLQQVTLGPNAPNTHKDPADAALASQPADGS